MPRTNRAWFTLSVLVFTLAVLATYSNHFQNGFHFDDFNAVTDNPWVRDLRNVPHFFVDPSTFSVTPDHQIYRPITTASLALDYRLAGGYKPFYFHLSTFLWFTVLTVLTIFLFRRVMDMADPHPSNTWVALAAAALYGLHPANAETVNYINQRADLFCTLGTVASLLWFAARPGQRKRGYYLIPAVLGFFAKPPVLIFPFVLVYVFLMEQGGTFTLANWREDRKKWMISLRATVPALVVTILAALLAAKMTPGRFDFADSPWLYRLTQPWVVLHYFKSFFLPTELSADSDWGYVRPLDTEAVAGYVFVAVLLWLMARASRTREMRPAAFGLAWFFLAVLPTSVIPLGEVTNDHRMIFPFVGLALAVIWTLRLALFRKTARLTAHPGWLRAGVAGLAVALAAAAAGTHERNNVWRTDESLWSDVVLKSPRNGRGLMNYGLTFLNRGDYATAVSYFERALPYTPNYWTLAVNMAIARGALGQAAEAETQFQRAIALAPNRADPFFFYGRWLNSVGRTAESLAQLETALRKDPRHFEARDLVARIASRPRGRPAEQGPTAESLLQLSDDYYKAGNYAECVAAARKALDLKPDYAEAYNNLAAGYISMKKWDEGIQAAREAMRINPNFQLAKNNLLWAMSQKRQAQPR